jgi:hypothetical protein
VTFGRGMEKSYEVSWTNEANEKVALIYQKHNNFNRREHRTNFIYKHRVPQSFNLSL